MNTTAIPAATLILCKTIDGVMTHLFVERASSMRFAAGATVFPGGRVDDGDEALALRFPHLEPADAAGRIAAIRETLEEAGVAVGIYPAPAACGIAEMREALAKGADFGDLLNELRLSFRLDALTPFARWCPGTPERPSFDTRFYVARADVDAPDAVVDATENIRLFWETARGLLDRADRGDSKIIFPTRRNLERLAALDVYETVLAQAADITPELIIPFVENRDGIPYLCIPTDRGYPVTAEPLTNVERGFGQLGSAAPSIFSTHSG